MEFLALTLLREEEGEEARILKNIHQRDHNVNKPKILCMLLPLSQLMSPSSITISAHPVQTNQDNLSPDSSSSRLCSVATTLSVINSSTFGVKRLQTSPRVLNAIVE